jgi:predicted phosphodiesterase
MRLVFISDTHNYHNAIAVPDSDALIFCGDATATAFRQEVLELGA